MPNRPPRHDPPHLAAIRQQREADRNAAKRARYGNDWLKVRAMVLARSPLCAECFKRGHIIEADVVHHLVDVVDAPDKRLDLDNLVALCATCHNSITATRMHRR